MKNVALHNLGCKVNGYELDVMKEEFIKRGYQIVPFDEKADIYIINTCTVTNIADRKSRQMLHKAKKENPEALVVAVGCYVETDKAGIIKDDCIDLAVGNNRKTHVVDLVEACLDGEVHEKIPGENAVSVDINKEAEYEDMELEHMPGHTRAYIKIQDGCNQFCTYCLIPYARGRVRSRKQESIIDEVKKLAADGCKEVVITGIHIGSFGTDRGENELMELLKKIQEIDGIERIRLGSLEPGILTKENVDIMASLSKLCPHFHLSLQSGSDTVLKRMNRHYDSKEYADGVAMLRSVYDRPAITTDIIVGFPGETNEEFQETYEFAEAINFYEVHVFKYSPRKGTPAATMKDQHTDREKSERSEKLIDLTHKQAMCYRKSFLSEKINVLWEDVETINGEDYLVGLTERYVRAAIRVDKATEIGAVSGSVSEVVPTDFLGGETLLI